MGDLCGEITADNLNNCLNPLQGGTEDEMIALNKNDIDVITRAADGFNVENITLKTGAKGFVIDGLKNSISPSFASVEVGVFDRYEHTVNAKGFDISISARNAVNGMTGGKYVVLTKNTYNGTDGDAKYVIHGLDQGLGFTVTRNPNDDTQGAFDFTFATKVNKEPNIPAGLFITDEATTEAVWESLKVVAP
jgi:hypothetical protein